MTKDFLFIAIYIEGGMKCGTYATLEEAKSSFDEETSEGNSSYTVAAAIYDLSASPSFGRGDYGFYGDPIEEWENEEY